MGIERILVPVDFSPSSDAALEFALAMADACGAEVEVLHVWRPTPPPPPAHGSAIFAETPQGLALEQRLSAAESEHLARVCGRLEFGEEASAVILRILERERFDLVVMGREGEGEGCRAEQVGHVAASVSRTAQCRVLVLPAA